jgi:FtsH-binding integral membrane protein
MNDQDSAKLEEEARAHPLTFVLTLVFTSVGGLGLIYIFAFSDTAKERWQHFYLVLSAAALVGTSLAFAKRREDRNPFSIRTRRVIWGLVLASYLGALALILRFGASPFARFTDTLRLLCYLGSLSPLAFVAWKLFRTNVKD